jgi:hypothetical protein
MNKLQTMRARELLQSSSKVAFWRERAGPQTHPPPGPNPFATNHAHHRSRLHSITPPTTPTLVKYRSAKGLEGPSQKQGRKKKSKIKNRGFVQLLCVGQFKQTQLIKVMTHGGSFGDFNGSIRLLGHRERHLAPGVRTLVYRRTLYFLPFLYTSINRRGNSFPW